LNVYGFGDEPTTERVDDGAESGDEVETMLEVKAKDVFTANAKPLEKDLTRHERSKRAARIISQAGMEAVMPLRTPEEVRIPFLYSLFFILFFKSFFTSGIPTE